jgi:hypothetical protein
MFYRPQVSEGKVIWLKKVKGRSGTETKRLTGTLDSIHDDYCTVEIDGERFSARTEDGNTAPFKDDRRSVVRLFNCSCGTCE